MGIEIGNENENNTHPYTWCLDLRVRIGIVNGNEIYENRYPKESVKNNFMLTLRSQFLFQYFISQNY